MINKLELINKILIKIKNIKKEDIDKAINKIKKESERK